MSIIHRTPRTSLRWSTLSDWLQVAYRLEQRRSGTLNGRRKELHVEVLPVRLIEECDNTEVLDACRGFLVGKQPGRGRRADAPHTPLIVAINNRLALLEAGS